MSAGGVEGITHDTSVLLRPNKWVWVGGEDKHLCGIWPQFLRFAFGQHDIGCTPSTRYTESAQPILQVPPGDYKYSNLTSTIANHPHLFKIVTPIWVNCFEELLVHHPNPALVESVCHGLHVGFWPFTDMGDLVQSTSFLQHQRDQEIMLDCYSELFGPSLLVGMTAQPVFTVPKKGLSKLHLVNDHSMGTHSLNSLIPVDGGFIKLDNILDLVTNIWAMMAQNGGQCPAWLWKSDASQAYHQLPMHPWWQACQATLIDGDYHINQCAVFGNHASGHCWCLFFRLICWIAIHECKIGDILHYVDDAFSSSFSHDLLLYHPSNCFMPMA